MLPSTLLMLTPENATEAALSEGSHDALRALARYFAAKTAHSLLHGSGEAQRALVSSMRLAAMRVMSETPYRDDDLGSVYANRILGMALVLIAPH